MIEFTLAPGQVAKLRHKLDPDHLLFPAATALIREASEIGTREAQQGARADIGAIAKSISAEVSGLEARIRATHPGAAAEEFGRKPGTAMPPPAELRDWARRHGMAGLEFVIARAIQRRGTRGRFFMRHALQRIQQDMPRLLERAKQEIEHVWGAP